MQSRTRRTLVCQGGFFLRGTDISAWTRVFRPGHTNLGISAEAAAQTLRLMGAHTKAGTSRVSWLPSPLRRHLAAIAAAEHVSPRALDGTMF